jgi:hypothetical protein
MRVFFLPQVHVVRIENAIPCKCGLFTEHNIAGKKGVFKSALRASPAESRAAWMVVGIQSVQFLLAKRLQQLVV